MESTKASGSSPLKLRSAVRGFPIKRQICLLIGKPRTALRSFKGDDPLAFVLSMNLHRRHMNESQRAMAAKRVETTKHGGDRKSDQDVNLRLDPTFYPRRA